MSKDITLRIPKVVITVEVPDGATHQDVVDAFVADGFMAWAKTQVRNRKPANVTINAWHWKLMTSMGSTHGIGESET